MSLDLIYPGRETQELVKDMTGDWITIGPVRAAAHLAGVWWTLEPKFFKKETPTSFSMNGKNTFGPLELDHPWVKWALESTDNYSWLYFYAVDMCEEYARRFNAEPYIALMLTGLENMPESLPEGEWSEPAFAKGMIHP